MIASSNDSCLRNIRQLLAEFEPHYIEVTLPEAECMVYRWAETQGLSGDDARRMFQKFETLLALPPDGFNPTNYLPGCTAQ